MNISLEALHKGDTVRIHDGIDSLALDYYEDGVLYYHWTGTYKTYRATIQLREWAKHLHGNPPAGTCYGYFRIRYAGGYRKKLYVYI